MDRVSRTSGRIPDGIDHREPIVPMAIVDRMANISPTYLFAVAQVRTSCHLVHTGRRAHERTENLGRHDVLVWKHLDAVVQERSAPTIERPPLPAMDIKAG